MNDLILDWLKEIKQLKNGLNELDYKAKREEKL